MPQRSPRSIETELCEMFSSFWLPMVAFDSECRVGWANRSAIDLFRRSRILRLRKKCVEWRDRGNKWAALTPSASSFSSGDVLLSTVDGERENYLCVAQRVTDRLKRPILYWLLILDKSATAALSRFNLHRDFSFTDAEQRIVQLLKQGKTVKEIASQLQLSVHTVRSHLKSVFSKTGTRRQAEVVAVLNG